MSKGEFLSRIITLSPTFTKAEKRVADYILDNPHSVLFLSITDLAETCQVGDASVFRFCKSLGLRGYQEFKMLLSLSLDGWEDGNPLMELCNETTPTTSLTSIAQKVLQNNLDALTQTHGLLRQEVLEQATDWLLNAQQIVFFGVGSSMVAALEGFNLFLRISANVKFVADSHMQSMMASLLCPEDVAVVLSYSGSTMDPIQAAKQAHAVGAKVIALTRFPKSPLTACADLTIACGAKEGPLQGGSTSATISQLYLLDLLYTSFFLRKQEQSLTNKQRTTSAVVEKMV